MKGLAIALLLLTHETVTPYKIRLRKENFQKKKKTEIIDISHNYDYNKTIDIHLAFITAPIFEFGTWNILKIKLDLLLIKLLLIIFSS